MPTAAPVMASSASGVPNTRSGPYLSTSPRVVPRMALGSSTSRPKRMTELSRSISRSCASRTASTNASVRVASAGAIHVRPELVRGREGARLREGEGLGDFRFDFPFDAPPLVGRKHAAQARDLVAAHPGIGFVARAIAEREVLAGTDVLAPTVRHALEEERPRLARTQSGHRLRDSCADGQDVVAVDAFGGQPVRAGAGHDVSRVLAAELMGVDRVQVVLADEDDGQALEGGEPEALVPDALVGGALPEEAGHHAGGAAVLL